MALRPIFKSNFGNAIRELEEKAQKVLNQVAEETAEELRQELEQGTRGIMTDTGIAEESIYTIQMHDGTQHSGYSDAATAMLVAGLQGYKPEHIKERTLEEYKMTGKGPRSAVCSASTVLAWWEDGHDNKITKQHERAPRFRPMAIKKARQRDDILVRFRGILVK